MQIVKVITEAQDRHELLALISQALREAKYDDAPLIAEFRLEKRYKKRSAAQNRFLWGVVYPQVCAQIFLKTNKVFTPDDIHNYIFKPMFCGSEEIVIGGEKCYFPRSSTSMTTKEFNDSIERFVAMLTTDLGIEIDMKSNNGEKLYEEMHSQKTLPRM